MKKTFYFLALSIFFTYAITNTSKAAEGVKTSRALASDGINVVASGEAQISQGKFTGTSIDAPALVWIRGDAAKYLYESYLDKSKSKPRGAVAKYLLLPNISCFHEEDDTYSCAVKLFKTGEVGTEK